MQNAVLAYENYADAGTVLASPVLSLTPPTRLTSQFPQIAVKCRNTGENQWRVIVDLGAQRTFDVFGLLGTNLGATAIGRIRLSTVDSSASAGDAYDSGEVSGAIDAMYGALIRRAPSPVTGRYASFDLQQAGVPYIEAGRVLCMPSVQVKTNFSPGWQRNRVDLSKRVESLSGTEYIDRRPQRRVWDFSFDFLDRAEADGFFEAMSYAVGESDDVLLMAFPDSDNLGRDSIWGRLSASPMVAPYAMPNKFSRRMSIRETL